MQYQSASVGFKDCLILRLQLFMLATQTIAAVCTSTRMLSRRWRTW